MLDYLIDLYYNLRDFLVYFVLFLREEIINEFIHSGYLQSNFLVLCEMKFLKIFMKVSVSILVISFAFLFLNALCQSNIEIVFWIFSVFACLYSQISLYQGGGRGTLKFKVMYIISWWNFSWIVFSIPQFLVIFKSEENIKSMQEES